MNDMDDTTRHPAGGAVLDRLEERNYWTDAAAEPGTTGTIRVMLRPLNGQSQQKGWDDPAEIARPAALPELRAPGAGIEWVGLESLGQGSGEMGGMVGRSELIRGVFNAIERLGPYKATVLIQGQSGTGKELVARALHTLGPCPQGPFVTFNCSNLVDSLAESQLFGHVRGAFTDARDDALGYFRSANGGTLFLDEVGELPLRLQSKLLRAVESYEVQPVGSSRSYHVDIRLVTASNRDLLAMVKSGQFRDDLYYRLNATAIFIPPLKRRIEDLDVLAAHFIERYNRLLGKRVAYLSRRALIALARHDWPGNVREFAHAIESAMMLTSNDRIDVHDLPALLMEGAAGEMDQLGEFDSVSAVAAAAESAPMADRSARFSLDEVLKVTVLRTLEDTGGNRRRAAHLLGVSRSTLYRMLARYGVAKKFSARP
jgi:two-component system response regulator HydG